MTQRTPFRTRANPALGMVLLSALAAACSESSIKASAPEAGYSFTDNATTILANLRLDVFPTEPIADARSPLPQSFVLPPIDLSSPFGAGAQRLERPVEVDGVVSGPGASPWVPVARLPGADTTVAVPAAVWLDLDGTVQTYRARTDADGRFQIAVVPGSDYQYTVIPDDPAWPLTTGTLDVNGATPLIAGLSGGAPVYGRLRAGGVGVQGAELFLETAAGARTVAAVTDPSGFFHLTAAPGDYTLVAAGRPLQPDPAVRIPVTLLAEGLPFDVDVPEERSVVVDGHVVDGDGPLEGLTVRFTARSLDGLEGRDAEFVAEKTTDVDGGFIVRVPPGVYDVEVLPPSPLDDDADHSPQRLAELTIDDDVDLGVVTLTPAIPVEGVLTDTAQQRVAGGLIACRELDFGRRSYAAVSDDDGRFSLQLPQVPMVCALTPPADRADLALTRRTYDPEAMNAPTFGYDGGQRVTGTVTRDDEPVPFAIIEVRDADGELRGSALSDAAGEWALQLAP